VVENLPTTTGAVAAAVAVELALIRAATMLLWREPRRGFGLYFYAAILGAFLLHVAGHLAQAVAFRGYTPGVLSAVVIPPVSVYVYRRLLGANLLARRSALLSAVAGAVALPLMVLCAHYVGRTLWPV
jgi:hypothetical protein